MEKPIKSMEKTIKPPVVAAQQGRGMELMTLPNAARVIWPTGQDSGGRGGNQGVSTIDPVVTMTPSSPHAGKAKQPTCSTSDTHAIQKPGNA